MLTIKRISLEEAGVVLAGARDKAGEIGVPMCIAVTDESGQLVAFERMDGGKVTSTTIAQDKAFTAAGAKRATESYGAPGASRESRPMASIQPLAVGCSSLPVASRSSLTATLSAPLG